MCLVLFAYKIDETRPLILAANRDEFYNRPTQPMHAWPSAPAILAGKDLEQGGTWFGVNTTGRFALLTNYRDPANIRPDAVSRGEIIPDFLSGQSDARDFFKQEIPDATVYNGFNLLFGDIENLYWFSNQTGKVEKVMPGIHGLSNAYLDTPWPKVRSGTDELSAIIKKGVTEDALFNMLTDRKKPADNQLPDTGVGLEWERVLSPLFIESPFYGTRSSTVMLADQNGEIKVVERTYDPENFKNHTDRSFSLDPSSAKGFNRLE